MVCLLGPRQSGKTTLARHFDPGRAFVSLDEDRFYKVARQDPAGFIASLPSPVVLDEVQRAPELLPAIKHSVDGDRRPGRFLLTGSANLLLLPRVTESLAGRMEVLQLHPLTEAEKVRVPGHFLRDFLTGKLAPRIAGTPAADGGPDLAARLVAGGYPEPLTRPPARARQWHRQYLRSIIERDVKDVARVKDGRDLGRLLELLALRSGELLNASNLAQDLGLYRDTIDHHLAVLERLFLIRRLQPWHRNSAKRLIKTPKVYLLDSGLTATLADLKASDWLERRDRMGHLLESFVVQQLIAQAGWTDPDLHFWHYRDKDQVEVDLVITHGARTWGVEIKASASTGPADAKGLRRLAEQCGGDFQGGVLFHAGRDLLPMSDPRFLAVPLAELWER